MKQEARVTPGLLPIRPADDYRNMLLSAPQL